MFLVSSCSCLCLIQWSQVLGWKWRCSWSSADRRCSIYIWVINNLIAYEVASYIRCMTVYMQQFISVPYCPIAYNTSQELWTSVLVVFDLVWYQSILLFIISGLVHLHWSNHIIAQVPMKWKGNRRLLTCQNLLICMWNWNLNFW